MANPNPNPLRLEACIFLCDREIEFGFRSPNWWTKSELFPPFWTLRQAEKLVATKTRWHVALKTSRWNYINASFLFALLFCRAPSPLLPLAWHSSPFRLNTSCTRCCAGKIDTRTNTIYDNSFIRLKLYENMKHWHWLDPFLFRFALPLSGSRSAHSVLAQKCIVDKNILEEI